MITDPRVLQADHVPRDIVHRDHELNTLASALRPLTTGNRAETTLLSGPTGVGKTCTARYVILNTGGGALDCGAVEDELEAVSGGVSVSVTVADDEPALLDAMQQILFERFDKQYNRLIAYNAETWKSGFDLPFLRTRCFVHDFSWLFDGLQFCDLWEPVKKRVNTTCTAHGNSTSVNSLTGAHKLLFDQTTPTTLTSDSQMDTNHPWYTNTQYDPFDDSSSAVRCYNRGEFRPIIQHNLADVHRTWELGELIRAFVSAKDITDKKL